MLNICAHVGKRYGARLSLMQDCSKFQCFQYHAWLSKVKARVLKPIQQPGSHWDRLSALPFVGVKPTEVIARNSQLPGHLETSTQEWKILPGLVFCKYLQNLLFGDLTLSTLYRSYHNGFCGQRKPVHTVGQGSVL